MIIDKKIVYARKKEEFEPLIPTIPEGLNPVVFIEDTREMWTCGTYFSIGYPSIEVSEVSGSVKVQIGNSFFLLTPTGDSISLRKGDGNRIIISSNALNRVDTEPPLKWDASNRKLLHMESGVASGSYGQSTNLGNASVFVVPNFIVDATGHITFAENHNIEIRDYVEQVAPSNQMAERNILLSYNEANNNMDTSQVRKANGLTFNDATQRITVAGGMVSDGAVTVNHGDVSVLDGYIIGKLKGDVEGQATPKIHLSLKPEYGGASTKLYGHVKLQDILSRKPDPSSDNENINDTNVVAAIAASPLMVWNAIETAKSYADSILGSNNAMLFKGALEAGISSPGTYTPMADIGNTYVVTFGNGAYRDSVGYINGVSVEVGDLLICKEATTASDGTNWEEVSKKWTYVQTNTTGVVSGPSSATIGQLAVFDSITGKLIKGLPNGSVGQMLVIGESGIPAWANKPDRLNYALSFQVKGVEFTSFDGYEAKKVNFIAGDNMFITSDNQGNLTLAADPGSDTVNTAGATDLINTKLFLIGAESQTESPQTYSNRYVYVGADNCLYSDGKKVSTTDHTHPIYVTLDTEQTINGSKTFTTPIISTVASGTAPFRVASNTLVTNLNADRLDNLHENSFLRYRDTVTTQVNTLWAQIGIRQYNKALPDGLEESNTYNYGSVISLPGNNSRLDIWYNHHSSDAEYKSNGIQYRTGWGDGKMPWRTLLDTVNYPSYADSHYVTIATDQAVTGTKTFSKYIKFSNSWESAGLMGSGDISLGASNRNLVYLNTTEFRPHGAETNKIALGNDSGYWKSVTSGQFISKVGSGTAPLVVASNTLVSNLNADLLDGLHENSFLRYRDTVTTQVNTLWAQIGIRQYNKALPDGLEESNTYNYGSVISLPGNNSRLDIWYNHHSSDAEYKSNGIQYRTGWGDGKMPWRTLLDTVNYPSYADSHYVTIATDQAVTGTKTFSKYIKFSNSWESAGLMGSGDISLGASNRNLVYLNTTEFRPHGAETNKIALGNDSGYWKSVTSGQFISKVGSGTAPLVVASNTLVSNLNADLLDGLHAKSFIFYKEEDFDPATYDGYYMGMTTKSGINTNWWHIISMNWGGSNMGIVGNKAWVTQLALPTQDRRGLKYRTGNSTSYGSWVDILDVTNYAGTLDGRYLKKAGDTMTGTLGMGANTIYWRESGFGDKFGLTPYFSGTDDSNYLAFMSSVGAAGTDPTMTAKMVLTGLGNVGIGTTTPTQKLHVIGGGLFTALLTTTGITNNGTLTQNGDIIINQASTTGTRQVRFQGGDNDYGRVAYGGTASNAGWMEIASCDDGNEPIYARQYTGVFTTVKRTATLLDANGNTVFPGTVTAPTFTGALNGTAEWSKRLATNSQLTFGLNGLTYFNANLGAGTAANQNVGPTAQWWHILRMNHGNGSGYFADIAVPLNTSDGIYWRRIQGGTNYGWYRVLDTNNYAGIIDGRYVNVTGDTMTGALSVATHLEVRAANTTTNAMLILHNPNRSWGNITFRDNMFYFVYGNSSTGTTYRPIKANYYIASATTLCTNLNADLLDGLHENSFLRYRDAYGNDGYNTLWSQIGIRQYNNAKPDGMANPIYNYGAVISLPGANTRLDIWYNHTSSASDSSTNGIQYRSGWGTDKKPWRMLLDSVNAKHYNVGSATKLQTARQINGTNFDGTANIVTSYWGTARNFTIGNTTRSVNGSGNVTWSFADIGGAPASHSHNYINSRGNLNPQTGRTQNLGNVYSYNTVSGTSNGAPTTYTSVIGFGRSTGGTVEIAGGWTVGMGLWYRALRDTTDNWYGWVKVWDTKNFDPNSKANSNHNHDGSYITKGGSNNNVVLGAGGYRALSDFTLNSNWAASKDVSGYVKFPNGFIIQWGEAYVGANSTGYKSFPIAFPTACISVQVTHKTTATNWDKVCVAGNYTRTSCTIANGETVNSMINWMALGY